MKIAPSTPRGRYRPFWLPQNYISKASKTLQISKISVEASIQNAKFCSNVSSYSQDFYWPFL
ncbi:hypothetical protein T4B_3143 [Trichinella pseudospiralis]|uniref:Uncharacterized protein n=1 Tax=Trichinella pseudospiralis TaxID=6337 RepID=A0A0V1K552_TRIPS|nr:hypothetical protein T4A_3693 [Trichinella pseudospiralis]KRZ22737.1 hypothetical protein T4B_3143 [Trichinella pseudospiralis]KRZ42362.1 hypothetical protein T4C_13121 [Trichinella pseudospiralis]